jgi:hypothetical protein
MIWLFNFLPDWIFHLVVFAGVLGLLASTFFGFIPFISKYTLPVKVVSILLLVVGVWFEGGLSNNQAWMDKVHELEKKVAEAEAKSAEANSKLISQIAAKNKEIAEVQTKLKLKIKEAASVIDSECKVSTYAIDIINESARGPKGGKK